MEPPATSACSLRTDAPPVSLVSGEPGGWNALLALLLAVYATPGQAVVVYQDDGQVTAVTTAR